MRCVRTAGQEYTGHYRSNYLALTSLVTHLWALTTPVINSSGQVVKKKITVVKKKINAAVLCFQIQIFHHAHKGKFFDMKNTILPSYSPNLMRLCKAATDTIRFL